MMEMSAVLVCNPLRRTFFDWRFLIGLGGVKPAHIAVWVVVKEIFFWTKDDCIA
ncbi:MAG: hypothetical protein JSV44_12750 [Candidatus Zixiibacteriota bacterium]|nr:MAG: hypothetical protein JSV44_12750 [candidate division Zixibacteria bacterium]